MNKRMHMVVAVILLAIATGARGFMNLNFESYSGSGSELLPSWERSIGDYMWPLLDMLPISTSGLGLVSQDGDYLLPISGYYSAFFSAGTGDSPAIWQTDVVPANATHIQIATSGIDRDNYSFSYTLGGISLIESTPVAVDGHYVYTTDISSLAGQMSTMQFGVSYIGDPFTPGGWHLVDSILFTSIPEPNTCLLLLLGSAALIRTRKQAANKRLQAIGAKARLQPEP